MKKLLKLLSLLLVFYACNDEDISSNSTASVQRETQSLKLKKCGNALLHESLIKKEPSLLAKKANYETFLNANTSASEAYSAKSNPIITVPVVIHIVYNTEADKFSKQFVRTQIGVLNNAFKGVNKDLSKVPERFNKSKAGDTGIRFDLRQIIFKETDVEMFDINDFSQVNVRKSSKGGSDPRDPVNKLNIWVANIGEFAGAAFQPADGQAPEDDGVMISNTAFGVFSSDSNPLNRGRTLVHEVGHYLGLEHPWGDDSIGPTGCRTDDGVGDTPNSARPYLGIPVHPQESCGSIDMFMNYMDFCDDKALLMFTKGQTKRMRASFEFDTRKNIGVISE